MILARRSFVASQLLTRSEFNDPEGDEVIEQLEQLDEDDRKEAEEEKFLAWLDQQPHFEEYDLTDADIEELRREAEET